MEQLTQLVLISMDLNSYTIVAQQVMIVRDES